MPYKKEEDERSEINRDHVVVRGCNFKLGVRNEERGVSDLEYAMRYAFCTPSPPKAVLPL